MLEKYIRTKLEEKRILLMTHIVIGYPSFSESFELVRTMVEAGVDLIELQIPFSEPIADGPVILHANQASLAGGSTVGKCLDFARRAADRFEVPFLFMSYYNILFKYGVREFVEKSKNSGIKGFIVPDLPPEEAADYLQVNKEQGLSPIFIFSPTTSRERMTYLASFGNGFIYCVARKGVTGAGTDFTKDLDHYLERCRASTHLPLALGFGVKNKSDVDFLKGKADIAVIGTETIRLVDSRGVEAVSDFIKGLR